MFLIYTSFRLEPLDCCPRHCVSTLWYFCCEQQKCHEPLIKWAAMRMQQSEGRKWDMSDMLHFHMLHDCLVRLSWSRTVSAMSRSLRPPRCEALWTADAATQRPGWPRPLQKGCVLNLPQVQSSIKVIKVVKSHQIPKPFIQPQLVPGLRGSYNESYSSIYGQHL